MFPKMEPVDLDLHVVDPNREEINYYKTNSEQAD
jgi:hypothetical protein